MKHNFEGRVALVTGGTSGMGSAIADGLAQAGASVQVVGLPGQDQTAQTERLSGFGAPFSIIDSDLTREGEPERVVSETIDRFGRLDMLVNAAGIFRQAPLTESKEIFDLQWAINVRAGFLVSVAAVEHLRLTKGAMLFITSQTQDRAFPGSVAYGTSKAAVRNMVRAIAIEEAPNGVRANAIAPGEIRTALNEALLQDPEYLKAVMDSTPLGRVGETSDIVPSALHLLSDDAAFITGDCINVDGGWNAQ